VAAQPDFVLTDTSAMSSIDHRMDPLAAGKCGAIVPARTADSWAGFLPFFPWFPRLDRPERGWVASANNPTAPPDFPYPLFGAWAPEDRAGRAEDLLQATGQHTLAGFEQMQNDVFSGRAHRGLSGLLDAHLECDDARTRAALRPSRDGTSALPPKACRGDLLCLLLALAPERHRSRLRGTVDPARPVCRLGMAACRTPPCQHRQWFTDDAERVATMQRAFTEALDWLTDRPRSDPHALDMGRHPPARGDPPRRQHPASARVARYTLCALAVAPAPSPARSTTPGILRQPPGASNRMVHQMGPHPVFRSITWPGQSGHPGSPHYADQTGDHRTGHFVDLVTDWPTIESTLHLRNHARTRPPGLADERLRGNLIRCQIDPGTAFRPDRTPQPHNNLP